MQLIYINPGNSSVMESQVLSLLNYYHKKGFFEKLLLFQGYKNQREKEMILKKLQNNFNVIWYKAWPNLFFYRYLNYKSLIKALNKISIDYTKTIIHIRGENKGALIQKYINKTKLPLKILIDIRGAGIEEYQLYYKIPEIILRNKQAEVLKNHGLISNNTKISVVSKALKEYFICKYNFSMKNLVINPNITTKDFVFNENERKKIRDSFSFKENDIVAVISSGGNAAWQKDGDIVESLLNKGITILNLSKVELKYRGVINLFVPFHEVPKFLSAADIAILWRDENMVNKVASPSKFSEFAANGLIVIHNGTIDLVTDYIKTTGIGLIVKNINQLDILEITKLLDYNRYDASNKGIECFGVENITKNYLNTYKTLLANNSL